jgi:type II secretory pathway component GspD/PulD (secretin)
MKAKLLLACLLLVVQQPARAAMEAITLQYRAADELLATVQSMLGKDGQVSAYGNQLLINAPPRKISEIRNLLEQLDTRPRRLLISVENLESNSQRYSGYPREATANAQLPLGQSPHAARQVIRRGTDSRSGATQQVQTSEGYPALIQVGQSIPVISHSDGAYGQHYETRYHEVTQGFYVTARLAGEMVHLEISSNHDRLNQRQPGVIDRQQADTRVSGRLGEWIQIGASHAQRQGDQQGTAQYYSTQGREDMNLRVRVECLD